MGAVGKCPGINFISYLHYSIFMDSETSQSIFQLLVDDALFYFKINNVKGTLTTVKGLIQDIKN